GTCRDQERASGVPEGHSHNPHRGHRSHAHGDGGRSLGGPQGGGVLRLQGVSRQHRPKDITTAPQKKRSPGA
ncbi:unnamed protein product, partial [Ectocarpus sp. 6 AP-2014]